MIRPEKTRVAAIVVIALLGAGATTKPTPAARQTGKFQLKFTEASPLSSLEVIGSRSATSSWGAYGRKGRAYDVANENFQVYVPANYRPERAFGLFVWISAGDAVMPAQWQAVFDRNRIIYISADNTGNGREMIPRMGLQLDAVHNITQQYNIDPQRIYVGGFSGGAMASSVLYRGYPDVFSGAFQMAGGDFYIHYGDEEQSLPTITWIGSDIPIDEAKKLMRIVLFHGSKDGYAQGMSADYESFVLDDFEHVTHMLIDGMGHAMAGATLFEKGLKTLDAGRAKEFTPVKITPPPARVRSRQMTYSGMKRALPAHDPDAQAARVLNSAKGYLDNGMFDGAAVGAQRVLDEYATTPAAKEAKLLLDRVEFIKPISVPHGNLDTPAKRALFSARGAINNNRHDAAKLYLERVTTLAPDSPEAVEAKAWIDWMERHPQAARKEPTKPAILATIVFQSGLSYAQEKMPEAAREAYQRVVRDYPGTPAAEAGKKMLGKL